MQLTSLLSILTVASLADSAAVPIPEDTTLTTRGGPAQFVTYCSRPSICAKMQVVEETCQTFAEGFPLLKFDAGLKCDVYLNGSCTKKFLSRAGKVENVQGAFDASTDPTAIKHKVPTVGSFVCF